MTDVFILAEAGMSPGGRVGVEGERGGAVMPVAAVGGGERGGAVMLVVTAPVVAVPVVAVVVVVG